MRNPYPRTGIQAACRTLAGTMLAPLLFVLYLSLARQGAAQTVQVDAEPSHVVNTFDPLYALGSTVDRVPSNATDIFFKPAQIEQILTIREGSGIVDKFIPKAKLILKRP